MPVSLSDTKIKSLYRALEALLEFDDSVHIGEEQLLPLLAAAGDREGANDAQVLSALKAPNLSKAEQVAWVRRGLAANEKKDLETILDGARVPLDAKAKALLEAVLGRDSFQPLTIAGNQRRGLSGTTRPGDRIEAINLTAAPAGRLHLDDTVVVATADARGEFSNAQLSGEQALREGDLIRIRARHPDGSTDEWTTIKARGLAERDERNAVVALFRIGMAPTDDGKVSVTNINSSRQISEPGARLQFTHTRTGEKTVVTLNDRGSLPHFLTVEGKAGDVFKVAASDGVHNPGFTQTLGELTVAVPATEVDLIADPLPHQDERKDDGTPRVGKKRFTGPLFKEGVAYTDVRQGQLGNCYFSSAVAAVAFFNPEAIAKRIKDNGDGTYRITFKEYDWKRMKYVDVPVKIDGDLYVRSWGGPVYGVSNSNDRGEESMELWYPLLEKAYAQWKGGYDVIGSGGYAGNVMQALLGRRHDVLSVDGAQEAEVWSTLKQAMDTRQPMSATTYGESQAARFTNTGVYADHSYSVIGYEEKNGVKYVKLRNPWGESEPRGYGENDGIFSLPLADLLKLFSQLEYLVAGR